MRLDALFYGAQIVTSVGAIVFLDFIAVQITANMLALPRNEHNSTIAQWTVIERRLRKIPRAARPDLNLRTQSAAPAN